MILEIKNELENKLQSGEDLKQDLLKLDDLFKNAKYALPYKNISVEIKKQTNDEQSMASGCFMKNGKILYGENGKHHFSTNYEEHERVNVEQNKKRGSASN